MVRVPTATSAGLGEIKTASGALPMQSISSPIEAFGGQEAKGFIQGGAQLQEGAAGLMRYAAVERAKEDERGILEVQEQINQWERDRMRGENGVYNVRGGAAIGLTKKTEEDFDAAKAKWLEGKTFSGAGQVAAERLITRSKDQIAGRVSEHEAKQENEYNIGMIGANVTAAKEKAAFFAHDSKERARAEADVISNSAQISKRLGESEEVAAVRVQKELSEMNMGVINRLLTAKDTAGAQAVLEEAKKKGAISGADLGKAEAAFQKVNDLVKSQSEEDRIMGMGLGESAALAAAREIKDPTVRDETAQRLRLRFADAERVRSKNERDMRKSAWQTIINGGSVADVPPAALAALDGTTIGSMKSFEENRARSGLGFGKVTDPATENFLHRMYMDDKAGFASYDLQQHMPHMTERDYGVWQGYQRGVDSKNEKEAARQANYGLSDGVAKKAMDAAGIAYGASASKKDAEKAQKIFSLTRTIVDEAHAQGKKASLADIERGVAELVISGEVVNNIWNDKKRFSEVVGTAEAERFVVTDVKRQAYNIYKATGVPQDEVPKIAKQLQAAGKPVTLKSIRDVYGVVNRGK